MPGTTPLPGFLALINLGSGASIASTNLSLPNAGDNQTFTVALSSIYRYLDSSVAVTVQVEQDDIQTVSLTGSPTGGTFTLTFGGNTTTGIAYNAAASAVQSALVALASIGTGNVSVSGSAGGPWTVEFIGSLADASQAVFTYSGAGLTGGSSPNVAVAHTQTGQTWTTISSSTYTLRYLTAQVLLNAALLGTNVNCRLSAFNYIAYTPIVQANDLVFAGTAAMLDSTHMVGSSGAGWEQVTPGLGGGTFTAKTWELLTGATLYLAHLVSKDLLIVSFVAPDGTHAMEGSCYLTDSNLQQSVSSLVAEDLTFKLTGLAVLL